MNLSIQKKFEIYNALFLKLSYKGANDYGHLIPILAAVAHQKLNEGLNPIDVLDHFYDDYKDIIGIGKLEFMFKVIQYVERQIVLFDSIEDSISPYDLEDQNRLLIENQMSNFQNEDALLELFNYLNSFSVRIVLTAHPTQFYRQPVLDIISKLRISVKENDIQTIDALLHQLGLTTLVNSKSPTPLQEAQNIIHICRHEYYDAIGSFMYELKQRYPQFHNNELIMLGFWPCGDRDGNPYVTFDVTREVIDTLRMTLMKCYYNDVKSLKSKLTFRSIEESLLELQDRLYDAMFNSTSLIDHNEMVNELNAIRAVLISEYSSLYLEDLDRLIVKMEVFKTHFASLDIRQDHSVHKSTVEQILKSNNLITTSISEIEQDALIRMLTDEIIELPNDNDLDAIALDTLKNIAQLPSLQDKNGEEGCHRYIISNSEDIYSVLFVFGLMRWVHKSNDFKFDIVPLFETMNGMNASRDVMEQLYNIPEYRTHLNNRNNKQTIMLGFSDGTKDGGYLKANWSIYKCKESLSEVSDRFNISAIFFDGRGGPPARGGGKTYNFYAARGANIANSDIQLTIQGQTITSTYGTQAKFIYNAEQMISSGLTSLNPGSQTHITDKQRSLIEELSELSFNKYVELKEHPQFLPYLENMTTMKFYGQTKVGSRPGKRNKTSKLTLSDLRAISYVGSWAQLKQNIPGFYGVGTALKRVAEKGRLEDIKSLYQLSPLFRTLIDNSMMSMTKCMFELTSYMQNDDTYGAFWSMLYEEFLLSKEMTLKITGMQTLMENEQLSRHSIQQRDAIVLPLLLVQHYALQKLNSKEELEHRKVYEKLVVRSLYGNINASRNSA
ncbi:MAG: phosphoenolpyruvate carboxylase [Saprospiraceae bacterium]|nr:phosphoenolpyruvate carboxylase [Saprospiraceae bacterium]